MEQFILARIRSFGYAFKGWWYVIRTQQNAWIHAVITVLVVLVAAWLRLPPRDWAVLILAIAMVWAAEFMNTAIEAVVDLASPNRHPLAGVGKDVGAAAVLIAALASVVIGLLILGPPLWGQISGWIEISQSSTFQQTAFKGMELYSWQSSDSNWHYAVLVGTNREKTLSEVEDNAIDLERAKDMIVDMAEGETLFWMNAAFDPQTSQKVKLPYPSPDVVQALRDFASDNQVFLVIP